MPLGSRLGNGLHCLEGALRGKGKEKKIVKKRSFLSISQIHYGARDSKLETALATPPISDILPPVVTSIGMARLHPKDASETA